MMGMLPLPDPALDPDGCGRYVLQIPNDSDEQQYIGRLDYQATAEQARVRPRVQHQVPATTRGSTRAIRTC